MTWLAPAELRVGLGCMRLPADEELALAPIVAAAEAGITVFDTARAYGDNERLLGRALRSTPSRIVTKGGMARTGGAWIPDGRAKTIRGDCEASLAALDGVPIDLYLIHAPDPRTPWRTSLRALARLVEDGLVRRVGVSNVNRGQLDEALDLAPIAAVQVSLSPFDERALRGGILERCDEAGIALIAHSPLGGPRRASGLARNQALAEVAEAHGATPAEVALAWLLGLSAEVLAIPGARRPETARSAARAAELVLEASEQTALTEAFGGARPASTTSRPSKATQVVLVMGIPGAGKTRVAEEWVGRGYVRLNRDERGGTLRALAEQLDESLASGVRRVVLDNTYLTRATRSYVLDAASRHGAPTRCVWLDTPLAQAQVNLVQRLLERYGSLPSPDELRELARREQGVLAPTSQMRAVRELEPPSPDEGFTAIEHVAFERAEESGKQAGVFVAAAALRQPEWERGLPSDGRDAPHLVFDWNPDDDVEALAAAAERLAAEVSGPVESALCPHAAGPPTCWCRPPLPGLLLVFARMHGLDPSRSTLIGTGAAHKTLATALGCRYVPV